MPEIRIPRKRSLCSPTREEREKKNNGKNMSFDVIRHENKNTIVVCVCGNDDFLKQEMSHQTRNVLKKISVVNDQSLDMD